MTPSSTPHGADSQPSPSNLEPRPVPGPAPGGGTPGGRGLGRHLVVLLAGFLGIGCLAQPAPPSPGARPAPAVGGAGIMVVPTRVVLDSRKRTAELTLNNPGGAPGVFRVTLARMEMDEDGHIQELPLERLPGQVAVQDMVRFAPRQVRLDPRESQVVRLQVRRPADLPAGEYRLYLVFRQEPPAPAEPSANAEPAKAVSIQLTTLFGMAIPLIIRQGETSAQVAVAGLALGDGGRSVRFQLLRTGNQSVYGDLKAVFHPESGKDEVLSRVNGLAVYCPNPRRNVVMALESALPANARGRLQVTYTSPQDQGGAVLAEASLAIP